MKRHHEVAVVGAGPAGSFAALRLAERGHDVVLVDRSEAPRGEITCTGIIGGDSFKRLKLPESAVIDTVPRARFISPAGVEVVFEPSGPLAYVVDRTAFDAALAERARGAGVSVLYGMRADRLTRRPGGVELEVTNGAPQEIHARAVVVATGHQRRLHRSAGLGAAPEYVSGVGADLPFDDLDAAEVFFGNEVAPGFFGWAVPFGPGVARLGVLSAEGGRARFERFLRLEPIRSRLRLNLDNGGREIVRQRTRGRRIVQGAVTPSYADRVLAVGEAAGQIKTTTSGGIYYGLIGAEIAAEVLSDGLNRDRLGAHDLACYERVWRQRLGGEIESGLELQEVARRMTDVEIDRLFDALNDGLGSTVRHVLRFDWHRPALRALLRRGREWRLTPVRPATG